MSKKLIARPLKDSERQKIAESLKRSKTPDDVIAAIFSFLESEQIPLDVEEIHTAMYKMKKKYPEMLSKFSFSEKDVYPFSRLLERVLFRLQNSSIISTVNPDFKVCIVSKESKQHVQENILPLFGKGEQDKLAQMGKMFEHLVTA